MRSPLVECTCQLLPSSQGLVRCPPRPLMIPALRATGVTTRSIRRCTIRHHLYRTGCRILACDTDATIRVHKNRLRREMCGRLGRGLSLNFRLVLCVQIIIDTLLCRRSQALDEDSVQGGGEWRGEWRAEGWDRDSTKFRTSCSYVL